MIDIKNLTVKYDNYIALSNITIKIDKGDFVYLLGPNGGGKTTLIRTICGLLKKTSGSITNTAKNIGYLTQNLKLKKNYPISVYEVIYSGFKKQHIIPLKSQKQKINTLLEEMNILDLKHKLINELSGGQLQRVLLCRALVNDPELLILDEPTSALDIQFKKSLSDYIEKLNKEKNITIIIITHDLSGINHVECKDRVIYIDKTIKYQGIFCDYHKEFLGRARHDDFSSFIEH